MRTDWEQDELISVWTLVEGDWDLVGEKVGAGRLGFALILKFYKIERRFPVARWNGFNSGCRRFEEAFAEQVMARLGPIVCARLEELLGRPHVLAELKSDPGPLGLDTLLVEIGKLAALCWTRQAELVDGLVELLTGPLQGDVADAGPLEVVEAVALVQGEDVLEGADTNTRTWARTTSPVRRPTPEPPGPALPWSGNPRDRPCEPGAPESAPGGPYSTRDLSRACGRPPISRPGPLVPVTGCR